MTKRINWSKFDSLWNSGTPAKVLCAEFNVSRTWVTRAIHLRGLASRRRKARHFEKTANVALTAQGFAKLEKMARSAGLTKSAYMRGLVDKAIPQDEI